MINFNIKINIIIENEQKMMTGEESLRIKQKCLTRQESTSGKAVFTFSSGAV
jgi:hypothetical protein